jgi:hypothetical protein
MPKSSIVKYNMDLLDDEILALWKTLHKYDTNIF